MDPGHATFGEEYLADGSLSTAYMFRRRALIRHLRTRLQKMTKELSMGELNAMYEFWQGMLFT